ncbi:histidinol dehydrogenase [Roseospirillum parvum]|uniref:Histidinol dehydrogenase n=1 Tax=Roseospirillum parvum TaxID=83401 RepID=A0A1G8BWF2_9PROT|nr:histidinol dehydrogenase [Roseospirillum parvum]SDH37566.1 histidinol dehydrogenase [Roseospirillum parvum]
MARELISTAPGFDGAFAALLETQREAASAVDQTVAEIIADVRARGDAALIELTARFDRFTPESPEDLRIGPDEIAAAAERCDPALIDALKLAAQRIRAYHEAQKPADFETTDADGVRAGMRWRPVSAAGLYVPGGTAAYPSSVLMNALPAKVAGVGRLVMVVPTPDRVLNPLVLAAAHLAGVDEAYRIGGAQAVAALAHGTQTIAPVDKIVGPGNAYVATAKRQVFGTVGIDMIAGPSEILIVADGDNDPAWLAADLLSQAEHDAAAQAILITDDPLLARRVAQAVDSLLKTLPRADIATRSWQANGAIIVVEDLYDEAPALVDRIAPEHLELAVDDPDRLADKVNHAGAIFLGRFTPEAVGDYVGGPNHVLPTARSARFSSGLGVLDFMKRTSLLGCDADSLRRIGPAALALAGAEGLHAHGLSVGLRLNMPVPGMPAAPTGDPGD